MADLTVCNFAGLDNEQLRSIVQAIGEGIQLWDTQGYLTFANPAGLAHLNDVAGQSIGQHWSRLTHRPVSGSDESDQNFPISRILAGAPADEALVKIDASGLSTRWLRLHAQPMRSADGALSGVLTSTTDITQLVEQENLLKQQLHYDILTGLPNRVLFADRLDQALAHARRHGHNLAVCLLDLDGFKPVNDTHGHATGDQILREVAGRLREALRSGDTAARLGGDEFALLIGELKTSSQCEYVIRRLLQTLAAPYRVEGGEVRLTASIGVTLFPGDPLDPDQLLRHADQAMYKAKQSGKNGFCIFDPTQESRSRANLGLIRKIERALEHNEFKLHYQPKVDCRAGQVVGLEALIRWNHPILGLKMPGEFLPLIEHEDVIVRIGEWVIHEALQQQMALRNLGYDLSISVNIAARQLMRRQFAEHLESLLADATLPLHKLEIEILESAALEDIGTVSKLIASFQQRGIRFALDDFGTGFSSLVHLKRLAANVLKIDQTFVREMLEDPGDLAIVQGVVGLADAFQRQVVAEGVEDIAHVRRLLDLGCHVMQGYGISRPLAPEALLPWLQTFRPNPLWYRDARHTH